MNDIQTYVLYPLLYSGITYWSLAGYWFLFDVFVAPYGRIQGGEKIDWKLYKKTVKHVFYLQSITPIILYLLIPIWKYLNIDTTFNTFFTWETLYKFLLYPLISDFIFYSTHRITHHNLLYKIVHKKHHEWIVPCAVAASYTTIYEYIFLNLPVLLLPAMILRINWNGSNIWFVIMTIKVVNEHSGYTYFNISKHHTNHHKYQNYNYGSFFLDSVFHTIK